MICGAAGFDERGTPRSRVKGGVIVLEYNNILFCTDFSEDANIAFLHALNIAKKYGAKLHILHIPHSPYTYSRNIVDEHIGEGKGHEGEAFLDGDILVKAEESLKNAYIKRCGDFNDLVFAVRGGAPDVEIIRYARAKDVDLIVMGAVGKSHSGQGERGSTVASVSKYAHCHVMAIRNPARQFTLPSKMR